MKIIALLFGMSQLSMQVNAQKVFDVHLHGDSDPVKQLSDLEKGAVQIVAVSTSWAQQ